MGAPQLLAERVAVGGVGEAQVGHLVVGGAGIRVNVRPPSVVCTIAVQECPPHGAVPSSHQVNSLIAVNDSGWKPAGTAPAVVKLRTLLAEPVVATCALECDAGSVSVAASALAASAAPTPAAIPTVGARSGSRIRISHGQRQRRRRMPRSVAATSCPRSPRGSPMLMPAPSPSSGCAAVPGRG